MVKEKNVELIELFYDLIYVYAISRLTALLEVFDSFHIFRYLVLFFVILQAWLYLTNYVNRYGQWRWYEYVLTLVNMIAAIYLSNTISVAWESNYFPFNVAMLVMLATVAILYFIQTKEEDPEAAKNSLNILLIVCGIYILGIVLSFFNVPIIVLLLNVVAILVGAFLPFFMKGHFDESIISFPHLAERFELLTIITFGESVVGMTDYFDISHFSILPILIFIFILSLFGSYVIHIHYLCDHHRVDRALRLMFSHYFIVIAINLVTIAIHSMNPYVLVVGTLLFYVACYANRYYYYPKYKKNDSKQFVKLLLQILGIVVTLVFEQIMVGLLIMSLSTFIYLLYKLQSA